MRQMNLPKNEEAVKKFLFSKLSGAPGLKLQDKMFFSVASLALAAFAFVVVAAASKNSVALAGINPLATPEAKGRNLLSSAAKQAETDLRETLPEDEVLEKQALAHELRAAVEAPEVKWVEDKELEREQELDPERNNQKFVVDNQVVESLGQAIQLRPEGVKKQVRFKTEDGETVFLGFDKAGNVVFRARSVEDGDEDEGKNKGEVKGEAVQKAEQQQNIDFKDGNEIETDKDLENNTQNTSGTERRSRRMR